MGLAEIDADLAQSPAGGLAAIDADLARPDPAAIAATGAAFGEITTPKGFLARVFERAGVPFGVTEPFTLAVSDPGRFLLPVLFSPITLPAKAVGEAVDVLAARLGRERPVGPEIATPGGTPTASLGQLAELPVELVGPLRIGRAIQRVLRPGAPARLALPPGVYEAGASSTVRPQRALPPIGGTTEAQPVRGPGFAVTPGGRTREVAREARGEPPFPEFPLEPRSTRPMETPPTTVPPGTPPQDPRLVTPDPGLKSVIQMLRERRGEHPLLFDALGRPLPPAGEAGRIAPRTVIGMATGAVTGATVGDSPEEKAILALAGGLAGAGASRAFRGASGAQGMSAGQRIRQSVRTGTPLSKAAADEGVIPIIHSGREIPKPLLTEEAAARIERTVGERIPADLRGTRLTPDAQRKVIGAVEDTMRAEKIPFDADVPVSLQIAEALERTPALLPKLKETLRLGGTSLDDLSKFFLATASDSGRLLGQLGNFAQRVGKSKPLSELATAMQKDRPPMDGWEAAGHYWSRFVNLWRGALVTALSTAVRNVEVQAVRFGIGEVEKAVDGTLRTMFRLGPESERGLGPPMRRLLDSIHAVATTKGRREIDDLLAAFPGERDRLFYRYASDVDVARATGPATTVVERVFRTAEKGVEIANVFNRSQEFLTRKLAFRSRLAENVERRGGDLERIVPGTLNPADVANAVDHALEMTFALDPQRGPFKWLLDLYQNPMGKALSFVLPFPRFMYNSWKFTFEHSPAALFKLLSPAERQAISAGDTSTLSKAVIGTGLFYGAWEMRNSDLAGERWYEQKSGDRRIDRRPFNPLASYLFIADLAKQSFSGTLNATDAELLAKDLSSGLFAGNFRAGAGVALLDNINDGIAGILQGGPAEMPRRIKEFAGEVAGGFLQPLTTFRELYADYGRFLTDTATEEAKLRDPRESPFLGPLKRRVPGLSQTLPERELPLRAATPELESVAIGGVPVSRQFSGISVQTRTPLETEAGRLNLTQQEVRGRSTGDPTADRLILKYQGPLAERLVGPMIQTPEYQQADDETKRLLWIAQLTQIRAGAKVQAAQEDPARFHDLKIRALPPRVREFLDRRGRLQELQRR